MEMVKMPHYNKDWRSLQYSFVGNLWHGSTYGSSTLVHMANNRTCPLVPTLGTNSTDNGCTHGGTGGQEPALVGQNGAPLEASVAGSTNSCRIVTVGMATYSLKVDSLVQNYT
jgi:hypothetical protein